MRWTDTCSAKRSSLRAFTASIGAPRYRGRSGRVCNLEHRGPSPCEHTRSVMFRVIATMRRGSASSIPAAWAHYPTLDDARAGAALLFREDRLLRVMVVRNEIPPTFVEWPDR